MEGYWGMGKSFASHGVTHRVGIGGGGQPGAGEKDKDRDLLKKEDLASRVEEKLADLFERTERLLDQDRLAVFSVTHALETHKTLTGEDVEAIIEGRQGPLIDGRTYHEPVFLQQAEAYHEIVMAAHASHGKVEIPLPKINGQGSVWEDAPALSEAPSPPKPNGGTQKRSTRSTAKKTAKSTRKRS
jgi:hypothetical protein